MGTFGECSCAAKPFKRLRMMKSHQQQEQKLHQSLTRPCEFSALDFNSARCRQPSEQAEGGCGRYREGTARIRSAVPVP